MTLIKSISGIRGTIGGEAGNNLSPLDIVKFVSSYARFIKEQSGKEKIRLLVGRDARISGDMANHLVIGSLMAMGADVIEVGLSTTPTVEMAVIFHKADGGIILTASHNPKQWNALKLLNSSGEFLDAKDGERVLEFAESCDFNFAEVEHLGSCTRDDKAIEKHIEAVLALPFVCKEKIAKAGFVLALDAVNSTGGIAIPRLLEALGVKTVHKVHCQAHGNFAHNPEPLPAHLVDLSEKVKTTSSDMGVSVDPDVDRLAFICEDGSPFGEEYTLVAVADYILSKEKGSTVSNLSSSSALRDITHSHRGEYYAAAVGEVNVVIEMKKRGAVIGGEGNGGVIYPALHYGRDALVGLALFLSYFAELREQKKIRTMSELRDSYPSYFMSKEKISLEEGMEVDAILEKVAEYYKRSKEVQKVYTLDGVKIEFDSEWVHLRKSNTEPIIRIYTESTTEEKAKKLAERFMIELGRMANI